MDKPVFVPTGCGRTPSTGGSWTSRHRATIGTRPTEPAGGHGLRRCDGLLFRGLGHERYVNVKGSRPKDPADGASPDACCVSRTWCTSKWTMATLGMISDATADVPVVVGGSDTEPTRRRRRIGGAGAGRSRNRRWRSVEIGAHAFGRDHAGPECRLGRAPGAGTRHATVRLPPPKCWWRARCWGH